MIGSMVASVRPSDKRRHGGVLYGCLTNVVDRRTWNTREEPADRDRDLDRDDLQVRRWLSSIPWF